jgi:hypothetical protein
VGLVAIELARSVLHEDSGASRGQALAMATELKMAARNKAGTAAIPKLLLDLL